MVSEVDFEELIAAYNCAHHPDVQSGRKSSSQVLLEALSVLFKDDVCNANNFAAYHQ